jgi:chromosome partitioning protein
MGNPAYSFQQWIDRIKEAVIKELVPVMMTNNMCVSVQEFNASSPSDTPYNLINIADFNSLIAQSQKHNVPVFALSDEQIEQVGVILATMKESRENFRKSFSVLANSVELITGLKPRTVKKIA